MPLSNNPNIEWRGWLIDDLGNRIEDCKGAIVTALKGRNIPKSRVLSGTVNMWWRKDSCYLDVISELDGTITATIHLQEYGTSLWVGRAVEAYSQSNYYKRMAASAFVETIDRCIRDALSTMVMDSLVRDVADIGRK